MDVDVIGIAKDFYIPLFLARKFYRVWYLLNSDTVASVSGTNFYKMVGYSVYFLSHRRSIRKLDSNTHLALQKHHLFFQLSFVNLIFYYYKYFFNDTLNRRTQSLHTFNKKTPYFMNILLFTLKNKNLNKTLYIYSLNNYIQLSYNRINLFSFIFYKKYKLFLYFFTCFFFTVKL